MRTIKRKTKIYLVNWLHNGFCYRTTMGCTWEDVKNCKRTAKLIGDKIEYEHYDTKVEEYRIGGRGGSPKFMAH